MTTSHRPQLEARSGAKGASYVPTGTQHARLLPGHTKLKLRNRRPGSEQEVDDEGVSGARDLQPDSLQDDAEEQDEEDLEEEDEEEEEDDQEALLQELNRIRQERSAAKSQQDSGSAVKIEDGLSHVPSVPTEGRSWRKSTTFGRNRVHKSQTDNGTEYQNDLLKSKYHQDFMRRYIK